MRFNYLTWDLQTETFFDLINRISFQSQAFIPLVKLYLEQWTCDFESCNALFNNFCELYKLGNIEPPERFQSQYALYLSHMFSFSEPKGFYLK